MRRFLYLLLIVFAAACGGGSFPFNDTARESGELAAEFAEGRAFAEQFPDVSIGELIYDATQEAQSRTSSSSSPFAGGCVTASALNIRSGPGTQYDPVGYLNGGDCVRIQGRSADGNWVEIDDGWVSTKYLDISSNFTGLPSSPSIASPPPPPAQVKTGCPNGCANPPTGCNIKGNISFNTDEKIYHVPGQEYYEETIIRPEYGERWFCTEAEAKANGWRKAEV